MSCEDTEAIRQRVHDKPVTDDTYREDNGEHASHIHYAGLGLSKNNMLVNFN